MTIEFDEEGRIKVPILIREDLENEELTRRERIIKHHEEEGRAGIL